MRTTFSVIVDDFEAALIPIIEIVNEQQRQGSSARARVASVHAATLLLAASFEEFIREMAKEYVSQIVYRVKKISELPDALYETAWRRTFDRLMKVKAQGRTKLEAHQVAANRARPAFDALFDFFDGDITKLSIENLIHNENNMRGREINNLFKVGGISDICSKICKKPSVKKFFEVDDEGKAHGRLLAALEDFFERRNEIAHSLNTASSASPQTIIRDVELFKALANDLLETLEEKLAD